jgi:hypothetical protein
MNIRYFDLTPEQKMQLTNEQFATCVRLEAVNRGIKPPLTLDEETVKKEWIGYQTPAGSVPLYEVYAPSQYGGAKATGLLFKTEAEAWAACQNAFGTETSSYSDPQTKIFQGAFEVRAVHITTVKSKAIGKSIEDYFQDDAAFDKLTEECAADLGMLRQADYDKRVRSAKRRSYMELAQGNEEIAKAFWAKTEGSEFPTE